MRSWNRIRYDESLGVEVKRCSNPECTEKPVSEFYWNNPRSIHSKCKECDKKAKKATYDANPEKYREAVRESARKHPDRVRARMRRWETANRERRTHYQRERRAAQPERFLTYYQLRKSRLTSEDYRRWSINGYKTRLAWREANKEHISENGRKWRQRNPAKHADTQNRRRARKRNAPRIERIDRQAILERDEWICYLCMQICTPQNVTLDHVIPLSRGGTHTTDNVRVAHRSCNCRKGVNPPHSFLA